jgi:hypothetical protein
MTAVVRQNHNPDCSTPQQALGDDFDIRDACNRGDRRPYPQPQPVYVLTLRAEEPAADAIHRLRRVLKFALRVCRLRCIDVEERGQ